MGQKTDPRGFRLVVKKAAGWSSLWYANNNGFASILQEDIKIRTYIIKKYGRRASIDKVLIERPAKSMKVTVFAARPGVLIGKKGEGIEQLKTELQQFTKVPLHLNIEEIRRPELSAQIVADQVAQQVEKRVAFRRAMKRAMQSTMKAGASGVKIMTSGRLNGVDIARSEWYREGRVPLHTLRADVDYATSEALTTYGIIGIKVWIYKGDINLSKNRFVKKSEKGEAKPRRAANARKAQDKTSAKKPAPRKRKVGTEDVTAE
jgi:small subunit ribosomal protein S3